MDNKSKIIAIASAVAVVTGIVVIALIVSGRSKSCQLVDAVPSLDSAKLAKLATKNKNNDDALVIFSGYVEYSQPDPKDPKKETKKYVQLSGDSVTWDSKILVVKADCGNLTLTLEQKDGKKSATAVSLEAFDGGNGLKCVVNDSFAVDSTKHYSCPHDKTYSCSSGKQTALVHFVKFEFETGRDQKAKPNEFSTPACKCHH